MSFDMALVALKKGIKVARVGQFNNNECVYLVQAYEPYFAKERLNMITEWHPTTEDLLAEDYYVIMD